MAPSFAAEYRSYQRDLNNALENRDRAAERLFPVGSLVSCRWRGGTWEAEVTGHVFHDERIGVRNLRTGKRSRVPVEWVRNDRWRGKYFDAPTRP